LSLFSLRVFCRRLLSLVGRFWLAL
jgi:hypothetical protein